MIDIAQIKPSLDLVLREGWLLDQESGSLFVASESKAENTSGDTVADDLIGEPTTQTVDIASQLPASTRIKYKIPGLFDDRNNSLSEHERALARYVQIIFEKGVNPADYVDALRKLPGIESVSLPPTVSLPNQ